jgi:hypothetical protein
MIGIKIWDMALNFTEKKSKKLAFANITGNHLLKILQNSKISAK